MTSVKWNGCEVRNPILRKLVVVFCLLWVPMTFVAVILAFILCIVLIPVTLPLDVLLKRLGRQGFFRTTATGGIQYSIDLKALQAR